MKAIVNGRILLPDSEVKGKALLYDERILGIVDEETARAQEEFLARIREARRIADRRGGLFAELNKGDAESADWA